MKYKKILVFVTSMIFITAFIFCSFLATNIAEIKVDAETLVNSNEQVLEKAQSVLDEYQNKNLIFLNANKVKTQLEEKSSYLEVVEIKKIFPNELSVKVSERSEVFSYFYNEEFYVLDENLKVLSKKQTNVNNIDGVKNLSVNFNIADFDENSLKVNSTLTFYDGGIKLILSTLASKLISRRLDVSCIEVISTLSNTSYKRLVFKMREGVQITITDYDERLEDKITCLLDFYDELENKGDEKTEYFVIVDSQTSNIVVSK